MNLVINSKFRPFTYDELVKPFIQYKEEYDKVSQDYSTLAAQTETMKNIAERENNPVAYAMYQRYSNDLNMMVDDLSNGLNGNNRRALLDLKRRYYSDIQPIADAKNAFDKTVQKREEMLSKDNSIAFVHHYNSVDDFLGGKVADNTFVSGNDLMTRIAAKVDKLAQGEHKTVFDEILGGQKIEAKLAQGFTPEDILLAIQNDPRANKYLTQILNDELKAIGINRFTEEDKARLINSASSGMYSGLQKITSSYLDNAEYMSKAERRADYWRQKSYDLQSNAKARVPIQDESGKITGYYDPSYAMVFDSPEGGAVIDTLKKDYQDRDSGSRGVSKKKDLPDVRLVVNSNDKKLVAKVNKTEDALPLKGSKIVNVDSLPQELQDMVKRELQASQSGWTIEDIDVQIIPYNKKEEMIKIVPKTQLEDDDEPAFGQPG